MIGAIVAGLVIFALGIFILWVLVYASGLVRPKVRSEEGVTGAAAMERKVLLATGMIIAIGLILTIYGFVDPIRQASATERQLDTSIKRGIEDYATLCYSCHGEDGKGAVVPGSDPPRITPQLNRDQFWSTDPDTYKQNYDLVYKTIQRGRPGTPMPAWGQTDGGTLNNEQIYELTALILHGNRDIDGQTTWQIVQQKVEENIAHGSPPPTPASAVSAQVAPELQAGRTIFEQQGCVACHATQGDQRLVGPSLAGLADRAGSREPGKSAEDYIKEAITQPSAFIVPGFTGPPSLMPSFEGKLSDQQMSDLIKYLESLK